jgi:hypothetical protein
MKILTVLTALTIIGTYASVFAEDLDTEFDESQCERIDSTFKEGIECKEEKTKPFNASARQDPNDLDEDDKNTLETIYLMKNVWYNYTEPCRYDYKTGECHYLNPEDDPNKEEKTTLDWITEQACKGTDVSDKQLCSDLNQLSECEQALEDTETEPVSTYRKFEVSDGERNLKGNIDLDKNPIQRQIDMANEDCRAIYEQLQPIVLGAQYLDFVRQSEDVQPYHGNIELSKANQSFLEDVRLQMITDNIGYSKSPTDRQKQLEVDSAERLKCTSTWFTDRQKYEDFDCKRDQSGEWLTIKNPSGNVGLKGESKEIHEAYLKCVNDGICNVDVAGNFIVVKTCVTAGENGVPTGECSIALEVNK